jgi:PAS domain S-box-containing protein
VVLVTTLTLRHEHQKQLVYWQERLSRIADANQRLLKNWVTERSDDAQLLAAFPSVEVAARSGPRFHPTLPPRWQQRLQNELNSLAGTYSYAGAYVLTRSGRMLVKSNASPPLGNGLVTEAVSNPQTNSGARAVTIAAADGGVDYPQVAFVAPIHPGQQSLARIEDGNVIGYVVLLTPPEAIGSLLFPFRGSTRTAETVLLALQSGKPVFISPLRHWKPGSPMPRPPESSPGRIALLERREIFGAYQDYRGVPVLAAGRFLPEIGWGMVSKVDRNEAFAGFRQTLILGITIALLSILTIISLTAAWLRHLRVQRLQLDLARGKQTEQQLRQSEERFWAALQNSPVVVFNQDCNLRYTWVHNPQPPWSEQEYLGKTDEEIIGVVDGSRLTALKRPVLETGMGARKEWPFVYRGEKHVYDINIQPLRNEAGKIIGITCASTDITEHKRAEDRLHEYEKAVEGLEEMIVVVDRNYRYRIANRAFLDYRGMQREQLIGRHVADVLKPGIFEDYLKAKMDECFQGKAITFEMKYTYPRLGERDLLISYSPVEGTNGIDRLACVLQDITERKRAEERLQEYERVVEGLQDMVVVIDRQYRYLIANRAFLKARSLDLEDVIGHPIREFVDENLFDHIVKGKLDACFRGETVTYEMTYTFPALGARNLFFSYYPIWGLEGISRAACIVQDVTDRKHAEKALRDSESRYRLLFERNPAGVFRSTLDGKLLEANEAFARMFGYGSREELLHFSNVHFYLDPEQRAPLVARLRQQGSVTDYEFCGRHRDGSPVWVLANMAHLEGENGSPGVLEGTFIDITARKNAEASLQRSEAQMRAFIEYAPYGIFRCAGNHFLSANPALVKMLGYTSEAELLKLNLADNVFYPHSECPDLAVSSAQQGEFGPVEVSWKRRDGALTLLRLRGRVSAASNGEKSLEAIAEDITQQRALEEYLNQSDRLEALGRLASGVAHDFNNLLLGITLNLEHVLQHSKGSGNLLWEEIEQALHAARSAAAVTRQLLVFGRKRAAQKQSVNLNDVVIRSQDLVNRLAGENIHVSLRLSPKLDPVLADPVQVQQVILNLVANARDAMAGRGQITIVTRTTELQQAPPDEYFAAVPKAGTYVMLEVSDTGSGITHEALTHIFEPFFTTKAEGSGLGLSTSYGIVSQSSGYISVRTQPGHGTTVRSYLPCQHEVATDN